MNTDDMAQTRRSESDDITDPAQAIPSFPDNVADPAQAVSSSPPPSYHAAIATDDPPAYDEDRLPNYAAASRPQMLLAENLSTSGMIRLLVARSETVADSVRPLIFDLDDLHTYVVYTGPYHSRIAQLRRKLELMRLAASRRVAAARMLADRIRNYEEYVAALPQSSGEVAVANQRIATAKQRLVAVYNQAVNADDGVFKIQEYRQEIELLKRQIVPQSETGSVLGRISRRIDRWLGE